MYHSQINGIGSYLPSNIVTNDDIAKMGVDTNDQWITERTGIKERRVADKEKGEFPSFMGTKAAEIALENSSIEANDIDLILNSNTFPDYIFPNTAVFIQEGLKITNNCACLDVNAACSGWLYAMTMANSMIESGLYKNILVLGNEMTSSINNFKDRSTCILFGDGCGAVILSRAPKESSSKILRSIMGNDSSKSLSLIAPNGGAKNSIINNDYSKMFAPIEMDGQVIFKAAVKTMTKQCNKLLEDENLTKADVNLYIPHQANLRIIEAVANRFEFPKEKVLVNVQKYANTSSASIPIALHEAVRENRIKRGDLLLMSAFGAGLSSAAMILRY